MQMLFSNISILDTDFTIKDSMDVVVENDSIVAIEKHDPHRTGEFGEKIDGTNKVLLPGFYNLHAHVPMTLLRGYAEGLPLDKWLQEMVWPFEAKIDNDAAYWATLLSIAEMLRFGVVSFSDMYYFTQARLKAIRESGIKANISDGATMVFTETDYDTLEVKKTNDYLLNEVHGKGDGRIRADLCIHGEYTTPEGMIRRMREEALKYDAIIHMHLSETESEVEECKERHNGMSPVEYFESLGVFDAKVTAAHCVWLDQNDIEILAKYDVSPVANPASNMKLGSGFAPIQEMLDAGLNVCLGTDGVASNNAHNILRDAYLFSTVYKGKNQDPTVVSPKDTLKALTINGAKAQGRSKCGTIEVGNKADLVMIDVSSPWMNPVHDPLNNIIYSANGSEVELTMVDGKVLYREGTWPTIDVERVMAEVESARVNILKSLNE